MIRRAIIALIASAFVAAGLPLVAFVAPASAAVTNTIEDNFGRADQAGWGTTTNDEGVASVVWGADGTSAQASIVSKQAQIAYPGNSNLRMAEAGSTAVNGGDALGEITMSAVGHVAPFVVLNASSDTANAYEARLLTTTNTFQIAKRVSSSLSIPASTSFTYAANTDYWVRLNYNPSTSVVSATIWADGTLEPGSPTLTWTDTGTNLGANLQGMGGSWPSAGVGEHIGYDCFAYSADPAVKASKCDQNLLEDNFQRADSSGMGTSTNAGGVSSFTYQIDGNAAAYTIGNDVGHNLVGTVAVTKWAGAGTSTHSGGDELLETAVSDHGNEVPIAFLNLCSDKSCGYLARLNTQNNKLELGRRSGGSVVIEDSTPFTLTANDPAWIRLNFDSSTGILSAKAWIDGDAEPSDWMVTYTDGSPLSAGSQGFAGLWLGSAPPGQQIQYYCYAYRQVASLNAKPCQVSSGPVIAAPAVTTGSASGITQTTATLNGTVNPDGASTTYQFEYGTTTSYGSTSPASPGSAGSGSDPVAENTAVTGLSANTTYHFRLNATNSQGTTHGADKTFVTSTSSQHKVMVIMEENHTRAQAMASLSKLSSLATTFGQATTYDADFHPSLPNYLEIFGGDNFGITGDCKVADAGCGDQVNAPSVWGQTLNAGLTAKVYAEAEGSNCATTAQPSGSTTTGYVPRHAPWPYWTVNSATEATQCAANDVDMGTASSGALLNDITNGNLPVTGEITPDLADDWHGSNPASNANAFLNTWVPKLMNGPDYQAGNLTIIITFDEDDSSAGNNNNVAFVVVDPRLHGKTVNTGSYDHSSLTKWLEDNAGVANLRDANGAPDLKSAFGL